MVAESGAQGKLLRSFSSSPIFQMFPSNSQCSFLWKKFLSCLSLGVSTIVKKSMNKKNLKREYSWPAIEKKKGIGFAFCLKKAAERPPFLRHLGRSKGGL